MNDDEQAAAHVMPALSAKPPSTAAQDTEWSWAKYIGRSVLFLVFHILGGPRFAFNMWHASRPLSSHAWQQFIPLTATSNSYAVQVSIAEGRQFSASLFLIAGLIMIGDSPASLQESSFRWQLVTTAAICLVLVSALQAISGPMHKSLYSHALKYRRSLTVFSLVMTIVFMIILEAWSLAYTYSMDTIESVIEAGNTVGVREKSAADREAAGDSIKAANEKKQCHPKAEAPPSKVWEGSI
ncbi:hypothetical protein WJX73_006963 [Symbiochloris irregularis]|uniref:Uncharacterized protein n=1 Tax=Symbiochloris irregularis TaxID=706552 RepID=A0AAW1NR36_9CHLO